jgi:hypothetical protein
VITASTSNIGTLSTRLAAIIVFPETRRDRKPILLFGKCSRDGK